MFRRVTIIGLGLIGGSLAFAIKKEGLAKEVVGVSRRRSTIRRALARKIVDSATLDVKKGIKGSDLVILATSVLKIIDIARKISPYLSKSAILIDAGSTKKEIVNKIEKILPRGGVSFIGSHPLAGSEKAGIEHINKRLFKGAYCILAKTKKTDAKALNKAKRFWRALGMKVEVMSPEKHDRLLSRISHLPHVTATALMNACGKKELRLAAGGLKDTTRIASSKPGLWKDIFITNRSNIANDIGLLKKELSKIESALKKKDTARLMSLLRKAKSIRDIMQSS